VKERPLQLRVRDSQSFLEMTIIGVIKGEVDKILEFHERRAR